MKRVGGLYDQIWQWDTLRAAFHRARKGARRSRAVVVFESDLDAELRALQEELRGERLTLGPAAQFVIHDPKERTITAPRFRERVLHHAIMQGCEPYFDRWLIDDSYACRKGKGRLAALDRATTFARRHAWFLKLDIRKYFDSIPHAPLVAQLERRFKDKRLLALFRQIIRAHGDGRGLPIGSLTSQHLANFYLNPVDRLVKEELRVPGYARYMDDFALWDDDRDRLREAWRAVEALVREELGLELKGGGYLNRTSHGMDWCGFRIFRGWRVLNRRSRRRLVARLREIDALPDEHERQRRAGSVMAFAKEGNTWQQRSRALARASTA